MTTDLGLCVAAEMEAMDLMTGGPIGDGIGPGNTAIRINDKYGTNVTGEQIWKLWREYLGLQDGQ